MPPRPSDEERGTTPNSRGTGLAVSGTRARRPPKGWVLTPRARRYGKPVSDVMGRTTAPEEERRTAAAAAGRMVGAEAGMAGVPGAMALGTVLGAAKVASSRRPIRHDPYGLPSKFLPQAVKEKFRPGYRLLVHSAYREKEPGVYVGTNSYSVIDEQDSPVFNYQEQTVDTFLNEPKEPVTPPVTEKDRGKGDRGGDKPPPPARPQVRLIAEPPSVTHGGSVKLRWSTTNAKRCKASSDSGLWSGPKGPKGKTPPLGPLTKTTTFYLTCTGPGGESGAFTTVKAEEKAEEAPKWDDSANEFVRKTRIKWRKKETEKWQSVLGTGGIADTAARDKLYQNEKRIQKRIADARRLQKILAPGEPRRKEYIEAVQKSIAEKPRRGKVTETEKDVLSALEENDCLRVIETIHKMVNIVIETNKGALPSKIYELCAKNQVSCAFPHLTILYSEDDIKNLLHSKL